ncbi:hypothetical protein KIH39_21520 [Telmatocola sphagniphila]|uniref:Uncharacterized protein n=1 Tax=Telmatocola sphagniphila TaxID=1123043 RepID=A0A8E6B6P1_9BACT|nr:hypothetical protein [Telmatocola sphagniphila]QVL31400.1 hypothetical protein KIH39_21520 [Telmatocola sphagniphila]
MTNLRLSKSQRIILEKINSHNGEINWYKLGRACIALLANPADFSLQPLLDAEYIREQAVENEPLPRLHITDSGRVALAIPIHSP